MALVPIQIFGAQFTSSEATFLQALADHSYTDGQLIIGNSLTGGVSISTLTAGSNITITNGHGSITIAASGSGGGVSVSTPTGSVNASNTQFTPTGRPTWVVADGTTYFENNGYSWDGTHINMSIAPSEWIRVVI